MIASAAIALIVVGRVVGLLDPLTIAGAMLVVGAVLGALAGRDLVQKRRAAGTAVLAKMTNAMNLSRTDRRAIRRLADEAGVNPASLLISRGCFDAVCARISDRSQANAAQIDRLRSRLFT